ncbi:GNAT family N-acetyltransferase [Algoriphagus namhaensis]
MTKFDIILRPTTITDLETLFLFQTDETANYLAAFTAKDPNDKSGYLLKYSKLLEDSTVNMKTIIISDQIAGSISKFEIDGNAEITYWVDRKYWGNGVATKALSAFINLEKARPIFGRVVFDNLASQKVLENCGFEKIGTDKGFANARQAEVEEFIYKLTKI